MGRKVLHICLSVGYGRAEAIARKEWSMTTNNPGEGEKRLLAALKVPHIQTKEDLLKALGDISDEERALLDSIDFDAPPTPEELEALGPDFIQRVQKRVMQTIREDQGNKD